MNTPNGFDANCPNANGYLGKGVVKAMLTWINFRKTFHSICEGIMRFQKVERPDEESLYTFSPQEKPQWQKTIDGYAMGNILVGLKVITPEQLEEVLERQRELQSIGKMKRLPILLMEMGATTSKTYLEKLSQHFNMPVLSLYKFIPVPSWQELVNLNYEFRQRVIVAGYNEDEIKVVLAEPNPIILEDLRKFFRGKKVTFYLANPFEVESCLREYWDPYSNSFYR